MMAQLIFSLPALSRYLQKLAPTRICVVTSAPLARKLAWALREIPGRRSIVLIPDGERAKSWMIVEKLLKHFIAHGLDRHSVILGLGGGSVGDSAGFAASIYLRGIPFIQIPTTLLAQVDSAHGGKNGINFLGYKNQIGTIREARAIIIDPRFLRSLSKEQLIDGLGEIIKAGFIKDPRILLLLKGKTLQSLPGSLAGAIIKRSIAAKLSYVRADLNERGSRQILNFGHTIGHALELKHKISHGRAVLIGMLRELEITEKLKLSSPAARKAMTELLDDLQIKLQTNLRVHTSTLLRDKKMRGTMITLPVIRAVG